jgi:hypothetical protein
MNKLEFAYMSISNLEVKMLKLKDDLLDAKEEANHLRGLNDILKRKLSDAETVGSRWQLNHDADVIERAAKKCNHVTIDGGVCYTLCLLENANQLRGETK